MTMKKLVTVFFGLIICSILIFTVHAQQFDLSSIVGEHIQNYDSQIKINKDGTIDVKETLLYDFDSLQRHGIYRDIPFVKKNKEGKRLRLDFSNISVVDENGSSYQYKKTESDGVLHLKIGDPNRTISGVHTYVISYKVAGALTYFSDHDELYWNTTGNDWTVPIVHSTSGVELPVAAVQTACYSGPLRSSDQSNCKITSTDSQVEFAYSGLQPLQSGEGITVVVGFPKNVVAVLEPKPYVTFWESIWGKITLVLIIISAILWYIIYPIWIPIKWLQQGRDPKTVGNGETRSWFDPPKDKTGRPLTPEETGALVDESVDMHDISGMIVSLAQRGYMKIEEREKGKFFLIRRNGKEAGLLPFENNFLQKIFSEGDEVSLKSRSDNLYTAVEEAKKNIYMQLVGDGYFQENPQKIRTFYTAIGGLAITTLNLLLAFSAFFFGRNMPRKTSEGVAAANIAKSLRNFLSSQERQLEFQAKNQMFFEKLLPYAIVFKVEKIWAERFKDITMKPPDWYQGYSATRFNSVYFSNSLNSSFSSLSSAATPTTSSSGFSSGLSGGSSGGGGGGGGGGSW